MGKPAPQKRLLVYRRDGHACVYCGTPDDLTLDHLIPKALGGRNTIPNLVTCCASCNYEKGDGPPLPFREGYAGKRVRYARQLLEHVRYFIEADFLDDPRYARLYEAVQDWNAGRARGFHKIDAPTPTRYLPPSGAEAP